MKTMRGFSCLALFPGVMGCLGSKTPGVEMFLSFKQVGRQAACPRPVFSPGQAV